MYRLLTYLLNNSCFAGDQSNATTVGEFFHAFNSEFIGEWGSYYSGIFFCLAEFYCDMGWTFGDVFLALLSVVLSRYFIRINRVLVLGKRRSEKFSLTRIEQLRCDHREVCHLVQVTSRIKRFKGQI